MVPTRFGAFDAFSALQGPSNAAFVPQAFIVDETGQWIDENGWLIIPLARGPCEHWKAAGENTTWSAVKSTYR